MSSTPDRWPALSLAEWRDTYATLHMYTQVVGKLKLAYCPMMNQWWQVALAVTTRGLGTGPIPYEGRTFELDFDFFVHRLEIRTSDGDLVHVPLGGSVKDFYQELMATLRGLGITATISMLPQEVPDPIPFDHDTGHATYNEAHVRRWFQILTQAHMALTRFRARYTGKCSPVHFWWGSFDLAVTRFCGRPAAPREGADKITRLAYNEECSSVGFWPGGIQDIQEAAFYAYHVPKPEGFELALPDRWHAGLGEYLLPYDQVRAAADPEAEVIAFAQAAFEAGSRLAAWPPRELHAAIVTIEGPQARSPKGA
ncbi:MAG: hypothetical protein JWM80_705 [Cyanobacteria bacterium RYN_339]|nr:hypothetical protein [Cyanobacteria bacterium RYN_339]